MTDALGPVEVTLRVEAMDVLDVHGGLLLVGGGYRIRVVPGPGASRAAVRDAFRGLGIRALFVELSYATPTLDA